MTTLWREWTEEIARHISDALDEKVEATEIVVPPDTRLGDFAFGCFVHAKTRKKSPAMLATELAEKLKKHLAEGITFVASGPYINVVLDATTLVSRVVEAVEKQGEQFGRTKSRQSQGRILIEYANPNTHKEVHIGHVRNFLTGRAFVSLLQAAGESVTAVSYVNDQGANVAKTVWWMVHKAKLDGQALTVKQVNELLNATPTEQKTGRYLGQLYTEATQHLETQQEETTKEVSGVQSRLEAHEEAYELLWRATRDWCVDELRAIFVELDIKVERMYLESDMIDRAQEVVRELEEKNVAVTSEGALIVDLEAEKLGVMLIRKSDGNLLYASKDLALAEEKMRDYPNLATSYIVVDQRQSLYFKQLSMVLSRLGYVQPLKAICYELVTLKEGAMSSRKGNIVTYQGLRDALVAYAKEEVRKRHRDLEAHEIGKRAWDLALGGMIFAMLKQDPNTIFTFDMEQALSFEGATGPYCQYAVTRLNAILRKAKKESGMRNRESSEREEDMNEIKEAQKNLALTIAQLSEKITLAAKEFRPSIIAQWCLTMARSINAFYRDVPVLSASDEVKKDRLALVQAAKTALSNGLHILGIPTPEEM